MAVKILIIEDDAVLSKAYELILKKEGHTIEVASNGKVGLEIAEDFKPQIILLDLLMPIMDGIEFLQHYAPNKNHPDVKIVILSNVGDDDKVAAGIELGAYKYIVKAHASPSQLAYVVNRLIRHNLDKKPQPQK
jgi:DNA-binding response OmpR family regulator